MLELIVETKGVVIKGPPFLGLFFYLNGVNVSDAGLGSVDVDLGHLVFIQLTANSWRLVECLFNPVFLI